MSRPLHARASWPLLAAALALATSVALGADAAPAPASVVGPAPIQTRLAEVEGVTSSGPVTAPAADPGVAADLGYAAQQLGWLRTWSSVVPADAPTSTVTARPTTPTRIWWSRYQGVNHVWMPTLGLSRSVSSYACGRTSYPGNVVYRWGCAGRNNVYLFAHNFGPFHPLYAAYYAHTLRKGMPVVYADGSGRTRLYRVVTWRVVKPTDVAWAIAGQSRPSMTLQTCVGPNGSLRLLVRLVAVDR